MKIKDYHGAKCVGGRIGNLFSFDFDLDPCNWYGGCYGLKFGKRMVSSSSGKQFNVGRVSFCLDWFGYFGEPNRIYVTGPKWRYIIGLPDNRHWASTDREIDGVPVIEMVRGRWRICRSQKWSSKDGWIEESTWFSRSPRRG